MIQRKLLHTWNYTLYTVYNVRKFMVPIKYADLFIQKPISIKDLPRYW
jgi:hypothetical protein